MTTNEINETLELMEPLFSSIYKSVAKDWKEGSPIDVAYLFDKWAGITPEEARVKIEEMIEFLKEKIESDNLIIL